MKKIFCILIVILIPLLIILIVCPTSPPVTNNPVTNNPNTTTNTPGGKFLDSLLLRSFHFELILIFIHIFSLGSTASTRRS